MKNNYTNFDYAITCILPNKYIAFIYNFLKCFGKYLNGPRRYSSSLCTELFNRVMGTNITHRQFESVIYRLKSYRKLKINIILAIYDLAERG